MRLITSSIIVWGLALSLGLFSGCDLHKSDDHDHDHSEEVSQTTTYYTCAMHPEIKEDEPGRCPICHMNLTRVEEDHDDHDHDQADHEEELWQCKDYPDVQSQWPGTCPIDGTEMIKVQRGESPGDSVASVRLRHSQLDHFRPSFFSVSSMKMHRQSRFLGTVLQAEEGESNIPARVEGRVERVYVRSTGAHIRRGDLVLELYSPKLISAGEEYLISKRNYERQKTETFHNLLRQSEERLRLWGIQREQYESWARAGEVPDSIRIYSPVSGIVTERNAVAGRYFDEGENFFRLVDLSTVWLEIDIYESDSGLIEMGQQVEIKFNALPGETWSGIIDFIDPVISRKTRTLKVRTTLDNAQGKLRPGMIAEAVIDIDLGKRSLSSLVRP